MSLGEGGFDWIAYWDLNIQSGSILQDDDDDDDNNNNNNNRVLYCQYRPCQGQYVTAGDTNFFRETSFFSSHLVRT
jgi:hypothetical protein